MAKATISIYEAGGTHINATREQALVIVEKLVTQGIDFKTVHSRHNLDQLQVIPLGDINEEGKVLEALREEGILETKSEEEERFEKMMQRAH